MSLTAIDTNILCYALNLDFPEYGAARAFLESRRQDPDTVVSELVLVELYTLVRNPSVFRRPLDAVAAAQVIQTFRRHPAWQIVDHEPGVMDEVWAFASDAGFARRRIFDVRLALGLRRHGVTHFVTRNVGDFRDLGFEKVWNPLA